MSETTNHDGEQAIRRASALLTALAAGDTAAAMAVVDEFTADVGIDQVTCEAALGSYEHEFGLDSAQRLITFSPDGTPVFHLAEQGRPDATGDAVDPSGVVTDAN